MMLAWDAYNSSMGVPDDNFLASSVNSILVPFFCRVSSLTTSTVSPVRLLILVIVLVYLALGSGTKTSLPVLGSTGPPSLAGLGMTRSIRSVDDALEIRVEAPRRGPPWYSVLSCLIPCQSLTACSSGHASQHQ